LFEKLKRHIRGLERVARPGAARASTPVERGKDESRPGWGIYTLANDGVFDSAQALFESVKTFAPELPLRIIPYDGRQDRLSGMARQFGYSYFESPLIEALDRLGRSFYPEQDFAARGFRKLASFEGAFDRFLFLDTDVVALSPLVPLLEAMQAAQADLVHFDTDLDQVYRPGPLRERMVAKGARGFNAGLFGGRKGALTVPSLSESLRTLGPEWAEELVPNAEQPFLNFYADRAGLVVRAAHELLPDHCSTCWPAVGRIEFDGTSYRLRGSDRWDEGWQMFFAHWAGYPLGPAMPNWGLFEHFHARAAGRLLRIDS
jgi:hypothetical protein